MKFAHTIKSFSPRHRVAICLLFTMAMVALVWSAWTALAANRIWTGGTPGDAGCASPTPAWVNPCNWTSKILPVVGDDLTFGSSLQPNSVNNFANGTTFNSMSISGGHQMTGNSVSLNAGLTAANGVVNLSSLKLNNNQTFTAPTAGVSATILSTIDTNGKILTVAGPGNFNFTGLIAGSGGRLNKTGSGLTILTNNNAYTGQTGVDDGTLLVVGSQPSSSVNVSSTGTLAGTGTVGSVQLVQGGTISPGVNRATGILNVNGDVIFSTSSATNFNVDLTGVTPGSGYDQINVNGNVSLGSSGAAALCSLNVVLGLTPPAGANFVILNKTSLGPVDGEFQFFPEGQRLALTSGANNATFVITYKGGDGNDVVLHVPTTRTWDGGGTTNNWSEAANWVGDIIPGPGDDLIFPMGAARKTTNNNDFPSGTTFNSIQFNEGGYSLNGNGIRLINGIVDSAGNPQNKILLSSITLNVSGGHSFSEMADPGLFIQSPINTNGRTLTLDGPGYKSLRGIISGSGDLFINEGNADVLNNVHTLSGSTVINSGSLGFSQLPNSAITLNDGTLIASSNAQANSLTATGGLFVLVDSSPTINGNLILNSNATYQPDFFNFSIDRLNVGGAVTLGNSVLDVKALFASQPSGDNFIVINKTSAGPVQGNFKNLPEGATLMIKGVPFRISYIGGDGNDVVLRVPSTRTWSGGGTTNNWSEGANWVGGIAPVSGSDLIFPSGAARNTTNTNDFATGTTFNSIAFNGGGYILNGNGIVLANGIADSVGKINNFISFGSITLGSNQTFSEVGPATLQVQSPLDTNGRVLTVEGLGLKALTGVISGAGSLVINGPGIVDTSFGSATSTMSGPTVINSGSYFLGRFPNSPIQLIGGTLNGSISSTKSITATSGVIRQDYASPTTISGNLNLSPNVTYRPIFNFSEGSIGRLNVGGTVNLADSSLDVEVAFTSSLSGTSFMVINKTSAGAVQGTFKNLPEGATFMAQGFPFRISYVGGDGNDVVLTQAPPIIYIEEGTTNRAVTLDSVTFVRGPLPLNTDHNFSVDHRTRVVFLTSSLGLNKPDPSVLTVQAAGFNLSVEGVGPFRGVTGLDGSCIVVRLPEGLPTGDLPMAITLRGMTSNTAILSISP